MELLSFLLVCFVSIFTMVDPIGNVPIFIALTEGLSSKEARRVAFRACLFASAILLLFMITGETVFRFFSINTNDLKIVGGIIFFITGYEMIGAKLDRSLHDNGPSKHEYVNDISITPLGIPMICGPGAITTVIIRWNEAKDVFQQLGLVVTIILVLLGTFLMLISARPIMRFLGESGNKVLLRLMGLIVMAIAVDLFFSGLSPILRKIFRIPDGP